MDAEPPLPDPEEFGLTADGRRVDQYALIGQSV
jgi:hypothetical protein